MSKKIDTSVEKIADDIIDTLCWEEIGSGISRQVFTHRFDKNLVIKIEQEGSWFQNIHEYKIWEEIQYWKKMSKWFAPCEYLSPNGVVLIQRRVSPAYEKDLPTSLPAFFTDIKAENFGMLDGRIVCFDYGTIPISRNWNTRLKKCSFN